ncbi:MAG: hypothetical protein GQ570_03670 [Helicobacteraceae bacterium]|nr:hypothetical protein [Helicobacteraceae bacterium]
MNDIEINDLVMMEVMAVMKTESSLKRSRNGIIQTLLPKADMYEIVSAIQELLEQGFLKSAGESLYILGDNIYSMEGYDPFKLASLEPRSRIEVEPKAPPQPKKAKPSPSPKKKIKPAKTEPKPAPHPQYGKSTYDLEFDALEKRLNTKNIEIEDLDIKIKMLKRLSLLLDDSIAELLEEVVKDLSKIERQQ